MRDEELYSSGIFASELDDDLDAPIDEDKDPDEDELEDDDDEYFDDESDGGSELDSFKSDEWN